MKNAEEVLFLQHKPDEWQEGDDEMVACPRAFDMFVINGNTEIKGKLSARKYDLRVIFYCKEDVFCRVVCKDKCL